MDADFLGHLATDEDVVGPPAEVLEDGELVLDLRAPGHDDEGVLNVTEEAPEVVDLGEEEEPGVGRQDPCNSLGRGVGAMRRPERIVHEQVHANGELRGERRVVARLPCREASVLEHAQARVGEQPLQMLGDRSHREALAITLALGSSEMGADCDLLCAMVEQPTQRRQGRPDAGVVRDGTVRKRNVEVRPDEDTPTGDVGRLDRARQPHARSFPTRSTRRQL